MAGSLILCLGLALGACVGDERPGSTTTLVFKHGKMTGNPRVMRELLNEFEQHHPGVVVQEEVLPASTDQQHQFYAINLDTDQVPFDVLAVDVIWTAEFARAGWILPLDSLRSQSSRDAYFEPAVEAATFDERLYAIPWYIDTGVLFYRRDLLDRYGVTPPRTWPELVRITRTILAEEQDPRLKGFVWQGKQYEGLVCVALEFIWGHGGSVLDAGGVANAVSALGFLRDLVEQGVSPALVTTSDEEATRLLFGDGRAIFMRNWPYVWSLLQQAGSPVKDKVGLAPLPAFPGHETATALGGWMLAIPSRTKQPREAAELIDFLTSAAAQHRLARDLGYNPARRALYTDPTLLAARPSLADLYAIFLTARSRPVTPYYLMLSQVLQPEFSAAIVGRKSPQQALDSARRQIASILHLGTDDDEPQRDPLARLAGR